MNTASALNEIRIGPPVVWQHDYLREEGPMIRQDITLVPVFAQDYTTALVKMNTDGTCSKKCRSSINDNTVLMMRDSSAAKVVDSAIQTS